MFVRGGSDWSACRRASWHGLILGETLTSIQVNFNAKMRKGRPNS